MRGSQLSQSDVKPQIAPPRLLFRVPSEPSHLLRARDRIRDYLRQYCTEPEVIDDVVLCVEEAATNAIRHSGSEHDIEISLRFVNGDLLAVVKDHGRGFDVTSFDRDSVPDVLSDHGRGLFIVAKLMDSLKLSVDGGLEVRMTRHAEARCKPSIPEGIPFETYGGGAAGERESRGQALLDEVDEFVMVIDWEYRYQHLNEAALRLLRSSREELIGRSVWEFAPTLGDSVEGKALREAIELGRFSMLEYQTEISGDWIEARFYPTSSGVSVFGHEISERKRIEEEREQYFAALRASEAKYRAMVENSTEGIVIGAPEGAFQFANQRMADMLGYSVEELLGMSGSDLVFEGWKPETDDARAELHEGQVLRREVKLRRKDGAVLWSRYSASPLLDAQGNHIANLIMHSDVTERKAAEEALRRSESRYRELVENANSAIVRWSCDGRITFINGYAQRLFGWSAKEAVGKSVNILVPEQESDGTDPTGLVSDIVKHPDRYEHNTNENICRDGRRLWLNWTNRAILDDQGKVAEILAIGNDVTDLKRAEEALLESEGSYRTLFDTMSEGFALDEIICDENGKPYDLRYLSVNPAFERHTGLKAADILGHTTLELFPDAADDPVFEIYGKVALTGEPAHFESQFGPLGRWFEVSAYQTEPGRFATVFIDTTERTLAEQEAKRQAELLDLSFEPIIVWRLGGAIESWNRGAEQLYGYGVEEAIGRVTRDLLRTAFPQPWATIEDALHTRESWEGELVHRAKDGRQVTVASRLQLVVGEDGVERVLESNRDITERKRAEEALRESEENAHLLADVLQKSAMPFGMGAPDGRLLLFNEAFERLTGYSGAELHERALTWSTDLTPPEWRATEATILARAVSERHPVSYEKEYLRKDGSRVPIELLVQPIFDEDGTLLHYRSFVTDISARKQAERALLERETEAARLDEHLPGSRTTRLVDRFRGHRWRVLAGAIAIQSAILLALNSAHSPRHVLGLPGSMIALFSVIAGALAGPPFGALVAIAGGGAFYLTVGGRGSLSTVPTTLISTAVWVAAGLLSGFLAKTLSEQAERRRAAAVALVRADAAREAQLAEQARVEELARRLQLQTEELQAAGEELSTQRDELHERAEREAAAAELTEVLNEMNGLINSTLDSREIMQTVVEHAVAAVGSDSAMVALRHGDDWVAEYGYPEVPGLIHECVRTDEAPFMVMAVTERRPIAIDDCESDPRCLPEVQRRFGVRSVLCIPLIVREEVLGVIFL